MFENFPRLTLLHNKLFTFTASALALGLIWFGICEKRIKIINNCDWNTIMRVISFGNARNDFNKLLCCNTQLRKTQKHMQRIFRVSRENIRVIRIYKDKTRIQNKWRSIYLFVSSSATNNKYQAQVVMLKMIKWSSKKCLHFHHTEIFSPPFFEPIRIRRHIPINIKV